MEIRDPVHGTILINQVEGPIILSPFFQRLRNIKQLGFAEYVFPGATHSRFLHSIGVMHIGGKAFDAIFKESTQDFRYKKLRQTFKLACLLHDIGHAPLSHSTEVVMPTLASLKIPENFLAKKDIKNLNRQATHEDYTIKAIADSSLSPSFKKAEEEYGIEIRLIAHIILGETDNAKYFTIDGINYFPILHQLVSSEMDCDRMDYLLRDSYFCGVSYGQYDLGWILANLEVCIIDDMAYLGISERAVVTFDDFLLSRYHMFMMVYFHYRSVCLEKLLYKYFDTSPTEYSIPSDIEKYIEHDDHYLMKVLKNSKNKYAKSIITNSIPEKIFESFNEGQLIKLEKIQGYLDGENIEYIRSSSLGRLSKYYNQGPGQAEFKMKVVRRAYTNQSTGLDTPIEYSNIFEATDLFDKFSKSHAVNRLHCHFELLSESNHKMINKILRNAY